MKKSININKEVESLATQATKEGLQVFGFDFTFKKDTIQFEVSGKNKEKTISLLPDAGDFENAQVSQTIPKTVKTVKNVQLFSDKTTCLRTENVFISGNDRTNSEGQYDLNIRDKMCGNINDIDQFNFVATPVGTIPIILTFTVNKQDDTIRIFTHDLQGYPSEGILFHWHLMLNYFNIIS